MPGRAGDERPLIDGLAGGARLTPDELLDAAGLGGRDGASRDDARVRVVAVMVASADGHATVGGTSSGLGSAADSAILRALRARADAILVGAGTIAAEGYGDLLDDAARDARVAAGRSPHPLVATISRRLELDPDGPLLSSPGVPVIAFTESSAAAPTVTADLEVVRAASVDVPLVISTLAARGVRLVACEGGPTLLAELAAARLLDDLLLTISPLLVAGAGPSILHGDGLEPPLALAVGSVGRAGEHLFVHYRVAGDDG